jgi:hypothetical protein
MAVSRVSNNDLPEFIMATESHDQLTDFLFPRSPLLQGGDGIRAGRPEFDSRHGKIFLISAGFRRALRPTQYPIQWVPGVKRPERKAC